MERQRQSGEETRTRHHGNRFSSSSVLLTQTLLDRSVKGRAHGRAHGNFLPGKNVKSESLPSITLVIAGNRPRLVITDHTPTTGTVQMRTT